MAKIVAISDMSWNFPFSAPNYNQPSPFLLQIDYDHEMNLGTLFHDCLVKIAKAYSADKNSDIYACYGSWIGKGIVSLFYPAKHLNDVDHLANNEEVLPRILDNQEATKILTEFKSTLTFVERNVMEYVPSLSYLPQPSDKIPFEFIYYAVLQGNYKMNKSEFNELTGMLLNAAKQSTEGSIYSITYRQLNTNTLHIFSPVHELVFFDNYLPYITSLATRVPEYNAVRKKLYAAFTKFSSRLLTFVPSCDNSGCKFDEQNELIEEFSHE